MREIYRRYLSEGQLAGSRYALTPPLNAPFGTAGSLLGKAAGSSLEFMDHRDYQPGDDLRRIDWSAYARTDRLIVKLYREEVSPHVDVVVDGSRSMALAGTDKARAALALTAAFASAATNAGYSHCGWVARHACERVANGSATPDLWDGIELDHRGSPAEAFDRAPPTWRPRGIRVLLSDLLFMGDPTSLLSLLADRASAVIVVQVLAEADVNPPSRGNIRLVDSETGELQEIFIDASAEKRYRDALARHQQNWHRSARQVGAVFTSAVAERICAEWDLQPLLAAEIFKVV